MYLLRHNVLYACEMRAYEGDILCTKKIFQLKKIIIKPAFTILILHITNNYEMLSNIKLFDIKRVK